jgi:hypothetical protein
MPALPMLSLRCLASAMKSEPVFDIVLDVERQPGELFELEQLIAEKLEPSGLILGTLLRGEGPKVLGRLIRDMGRKRLDPLDVIDNAIAVQLAVRVRDHLGFVKIGPTRCRLK